MNKQTEFKYSEATPLELNQVVKTLLVCSKNSTPHFPALFSKKIMEAEGLQCNESIFYNLVSNIVDFKLDQCLGVIKENSTAGSSKKQIKDLTLKTIDVQKYFMEKETKLSRPRVYHQMESKFNEDDILMPDEDRAK